MNINLHHIHDMKIAEITSEDIIMRTIEDTLDLIGNLYYQDISKVVVYEKDLNADFFDLQNKFAGEVFQKFSNYRIQIILVGDFSKFSSKSMTSFILESNKGKQVNFVNTITDAFFLLSK